MKHIPSIHISDLLHIGAHENPKSHDFEVDGIQFSGNGSEAVVTSGKHKHSGSVVIPASVTYNGQEYSVTSIDEDAFDNDRELTSIVIPESVGSIGNKAFAKCPNLTSVTICSESIVAHNYSLINNISTIFGPQVREYVIGEGVTAIGKDIFYGCSSLRSVTILEGVTTIGEGSFSGCSGLTSLIIPEGVTSIGTGAFAGCTGLTSVSIPRSLTTIGEGAFYKCSGLTDVTIPDSVTSIGGSSFQYCSGLTSVNIPESVTSIGNWAFGNNPSLTTVTIPESVTSIGSFAFYRCPSLSIVTIPKGVTSVGENAFWGCTGLESVICKTELVLSCTFGDTTMGKATLYVPANLLHSYERDFDWNKFQKILPL